MMLIGTCASENVVEDVFGSVSEFARLVEENGDNFDYNGVKVEYCEVEDIHYFVSKQ